MLKIAKNERPVLFIHIDAPDKSALAIEAEKHGLQLTPFCRMILLDYLKNNKSK
jgi:hypothetical protein